MFCLFAQNENSSAQSAGCGACQAETGGSKSVWKRKVFPGVDLFWFDMRGACPLQAMRRSSEALEICCCLEGQLECEFEHGGHICLSAGDVAVGGLACSVKTACLPHSRYKGVSVVAELGEASRSLEKLSEALGKFDVDLAAIRRNLCSDRPCCVAKPDLRDLRIFSAVFRRGEASSETLSLMVLELFLFLSARAASPCPSSQYFRKSQIEAAKKMHQRLTEDLSKRYTLEELSLMHGFPLTSMKSCFKEIYGEPIGIYMRKRRMSAAAAMLADSDATVAEIAESVGYESHAKFSAAFKSCAGLAPSEFRKAAQKG